MSIDKATGEITANDKRWQMMFALMAKKAALEPNEIYSAPSSLHFVVDGQDNDYLPAPDLDIIASHLINECPEFSHLRQFSITYLWKKEGGKKHGKATLGTCQKAAGLIRYFSNMAFVIWLAADNVNNCALTRQQVEATLYHELLHAGVDDPDQADQQPVIWPHDVEMFGAEVRRYGLWKMDLQEVAVAFKQLPLL